MNQDRIKTPKIADDFKISLIFSLIQSDKKVIMKRKIIMDAANGLHHFAIAMTQALAIGLLFEGFGGIAKIGNFNFRNAAHGRHAVWPEAFAAEFLAQAGISLLQIGH